MPKIFYNFEKYSTVVLKRGQTSKTLHEFNLNVHFEAITEEQVKLFNEAFEKIKEGIISTFGDIELNTDLEFQDVETM